MTHQSLVITSRYLERPVVSFKRSVVTNGGFAINSCSLSAFVGKRTNWCKLLITRTGAASNCSDCVGN